MIPENLEEVIERRNSRLLEFFKLNQISPIRLVGDPNKPAIIYQEKMVLSAFVHNFYLNFTDKPYGGEIIKTYKLTPKVRMVRDELLDIITNYPQKQVFRIKLMEMDDLYLTGYNFTKPDKDNPDGKYPVFASHKPKVYFTEDKAEQIATLLSELGYSVEII